MEQIRAPESAKHAMQRDENKEITRGDIYYAQLDPVLGSEQGGTRPVLVVQNDQGNRHGPTLIVVPITSRMKKHHLPTHVKIRQGIGLPKYSIALLEQIRTIDKSRLGAYVGRLEGAAMDGIDAALKISLGLLYEGKRRASCGWEEN